MEPLAPTSYWRTTSDEPAEYPSLTEGIRAEVAILGAGITGLTAALLLKQAGRQVVVLEAGRVGAGTTGGTSAHLEVLPDQGAKTLLSDFGESAARHITRARQEAIDQIEAWVRQYGIDCDFRRVPAFAYTERGDHVKQIEAECDAARRLGIAATMTDEVGLPFDVACGVRVENQARFHALRYLHGLAKQVHGGAGVIYENTRAEPPRDGDPCTVATPHGIVKADRVIVATHSAFLGISQFDMRMEPYQSYVVTAHVADPPPDALYFDDDRPYHYTRWASSDRPGLLLIGGADHKTGLGDPHDSLRMLEEYVRERFRAQAIEQHWSAEFFEPADGAPFIGKAPGWKNVYLGTGYSGTGLTYGTAAGTLLAQLVQGIEPPLAKAVTPARLKPLAAAQSLLSEGFSVVKQFVADRFAGETIESLEEIAAGEGRLVSYHGEKLAAYRGEDGRMHLLSPACTHAGCYVRWNGVEKTWDCPCHGGRYSAAGERIYGPPPNDLEQKTPQAVAGD
jgi:glycine/D-amino acid oxidase-like deaminating enzyme/nitrite reductase/ring-hydroxylating ferredoxin subunit